MPVDFSWVYLPVNGGSVAACRRTAYWSGESSSRHCSSVLAIFSMVSLSGVCGHTLRGGRSSGTVATVPRVYTRTEGRLDAPQDPLHLRHRRSRVVARKGHRRRLPGSPPRQPRPDG